MQYKLEQEIALWDPHNAEHATTDPYKTLFVARINYDTSESKLRREFEIYGPIKKVFGANSLPVWIVRPFIDTTQFWGRRA